jgi:hypothetical protein
MRTTSIFCRVPYRNKGELIVDYQVDGCAVKRGAIPVREGVKREAPMCCVIRIGISCCAYRRG